MMTTTEIDLMLFLLTAMLCVLGYAALGLAVLLTQERDPIVETITNQIDGWRAWALFVLWPATALWLAWRAWRIRRRWHRG